MKRNKLFMGVCVLGVAFLGGMLQACMVSHAEYQPTETANNGHVTQTAAYYDLRVGEQLVGDAKVWFNGIKMLAKGREAVFGLRVRNDSAEPLSLDVGSPELEIGITEGKLEFFKVKDIRGPTSIPPKTVGRLELVFDISSIPPTEDIALFELVWTVESGGARISKSTPFFRRRYHETSVYYYVDPFWPIGLEWYWYPSIHWGGHYSYHHHH